jgi:hypothetical protein
MLHRGGTKASKFVKGGGVNIEPPPVVAYCSAGGLMRSSTSGFTLVVLFPL